MSDEPKTSLVGGKEPYEGYKEIKENGQQKDYLVLSAEERAKGFVRPVRYTYIHVGRTGPKYPLRDLTAKEYLDLEKFGYVKYEVYPEGSGLLGRFWTQKELDSIDQGCLTRTTMSREIAETYARSPGFYGGTFCCGCKKHFPVGEQGEFVWEDGSRVGT